MRTILVPATKIDGFEKYVLTKYPSAKVGRGRTVLSRNDEILGQYFLVEVPGVKDSDLELEGL